MCGELPTSSLLLVCVHEFLTLASFVAAEQKPQRLRKMCSEHFIFECIRTWCIVYVVCQVVSVSHGKDNW
jgi:hypothetical protein